MTNLLKASLVAVLAFAVSACSAIPDARDPTRYSTAPAPRPQMRPNVLPSSPDARQCLGELNQASVSYTPLPDRSFGGGCSQINSVALRQIGGDTTHLEVTQINAITCPLARAFAGWARFGAARAASQILGSELVKIETYGSYSCRNIAGSAKRSEHAHANAIDVAAFVLADGRRITVKGDWADGNRGAQDFLRAVRSSACKRFGTVLSPDYNAAHADHFHFDLGNGLGTAFTGKSYCR
jgi:hypothetical protein